MLRFYIDNLKKHPIGAFIVGINQIWRIKDLFSLQINKFMNIFLFSFQINLFMSCL